MPRQIVARVLLVCAVLLAQQTALAHDFWHATAQGQKAPRGEKLCDLHDLLGTVLGALSAAAPTADLLVFSEVGFAPAVSSAVETRPLAAQSRGPPALS